MGFQVYYCENCNAEFGWCSVGGFRNWGEHKQDCISQDMFYGLVPEYTSIKNPKPSEQLQDGTYIVYPKLEITGYKKMPIKCA